MATRKGGSKKPARTPAPSASTAVATVTPSALPAGVRMVKQVVVPALSLQVGKPMILVLTGAMRQSTYVDPKGERKKPATIIPCGDVTTGAAYNLLAPAVLEANLREGYPDDSYVGKVFMMEKLPKRPGKNYFDLNLFEVDASGLTAEAKKSLAVNPASVGDATTAE